MYLIAFPLLLIPFVLYNMIIFLLNMPFSEVVFSIPLLEGRRLPVTTGDLLVMLGMLLLYLEVLKAARLGSKGVMDHVLSFALFVGMAAELALVPRAMTPTLLLLTTLAFVDVIIGVSFIGRRKQREIVLEDDGQAHEGSQQGR
jgi:undecaprenyl pyrophosphate phosphatase UppP